MSGLFRRIPFLVFAVVLAFGAIDAHAGYLFRLTEEEILATMDYYNPKGDCDRKLVLEQMSEPFDCRYFGELCGEVGEDNAYRILAGAWARAKQRIAVEEIDREMMEQLDGYSLRWFEKLYPDGVPAKDAYWGVFAEPGTPTPCLNTATAESGDFRVVHKSRRYQLAFRGWGRIKVEHFKKNFFGNFNHERADLLEVEGRAFLQKPNGLPLEVELFDIREDARHVADSVADRFSDVPYVEGCGGVPNNSALRACTCSGQLPFGVSPEP